MKKILFVLYACCMTLIATAQESQTVFNFLRIPVSAHGAALGGDNISVVEDDASLALSNPALLSSVTHRTVTFGYMNYMSGTAMYTASYTHVLNDKATIGGAIHYLNYGSMKEMDYTGVETGSFSPSDLTFEALLSYHLAKNLEGGIGAKFIYSKIGTYSSTAAAVDLGLNYYNPDWDFSASFVVKNLGGQLSAYNDNFESLPIDVSIGVTQRLRHTPFRFSLTLTDLNHWDYSFFRHMCIGMDVILVPQFYVSAGYNFRRQHYMRVTELPDGNESAHGAGLTFGAGLLLDRFKLNLSYGKFHLSSHSIMANAAFNF